MDDEREERRPRKEKKSFLSGQNTVYLVIFLLGLAIGAVMTNQYIDPTINASLFTEKDSLTQKNLELDKQADACLVCLQKAGINPQTCES